MPRIDRMVVGEALVGDGNEVAHIDLLMGPRGSPAELAFALEAGIHCFNVESEPELEALARLAQAAGRGAPVAIRVNPDVDPGTHDKIATGRKEDKFGIPWSRAAAVYAAAGRLAGIRVVGIDIHIGSQITALAPFDAAFARVGELVIVDGEPGHALASPDDGALAFYRDALGLHVEAPEDRPLPPDGVNTRSRKVRVAVDAEVAPSLVVGEYDDDVGPAALRGRDRRLAVALRREMDVVAQVEGWPGQGLELVVVHDVPPRAISSKAWRSLVMPSRRRDLTVPSGISSAVAISSRESPSANRRRTTSRCVAGRFPR